VVNITSTSRFKIQKPHNYEGISSIAFAIKKLKIENFYFSILAYAMGKSPKGLKAKIAISSDRSEMLYQK
jgi:hypothetical protein